MAPVLSRSLASASIASFPSKSSFSVKNHNKVLKLRTVFLPQNVLRNGYGCAGLKWKVERKDSRMAVRCEAAVAEKEAAETSGEKFEYQAEVVFFLYLVLYCFFDSMGESALFVL